MQLMGVPFQGTSRNGGVLRIPRKRLLRGSGEFKE